MSDIEQKPPIENHPRRSISISKMLAVPASALSLYGAFHVTKPLYDNFLTRREANGIIKAQEALEQSQKDFKDQIISTMNASNAEQTRVVERKVDKILEHMKTDRAEIDRENDRQDRIIESMELIVMQDSYSKRSNSKKKEN